MTIVPIFVSSETERLLLLLVKKELLRSYYAVLCDNITKARSANYNIVKMPTSERFYVSFVIVDTLFPTDEKEDISRIHKEAKSYLNNLYSTYKSSIVIKSSK